MRRAPGSSSPSGFSPAVLLVALLAVVVVGGTAWGYTQWQDDISRATDVEARAVDARPVGSDDEPAEPTPEPTAEATDEAPEREVYEPPTFDVLEPTDNRPQPVVLLVGDGYADGDGASNAGTSYPSILASTLGWDVRLATAPDAGYVGDPTLLELFADSPGSVDPDLVLVQGGYGGGAGNDEVRSAVAALADAVGDRYPDAHVVVLSPFGADATEETAQEKAQEKARKKAETQERSVARAWREDPGVLVLRPLPEGWGDASTDEEHRVLGTRLVAALRSAGLAPAA